ncbi:MAG: septal ring lytic transglycosylase RlpA family protein [Treponema sp.]|nr:septal ring lytic transglycosylase RlpA family protein [Treponema sp.]
MKKLIPVLMIALAFDAGAATPQDTAYKQEGIASWYGAEFEGKPTASGETFDSKNLTAAHPSLPFGTLLRVTNKVNHKQVVVRVNDRGPFVAGRIVDVSKAAAEALNMLATGTAPVIAETVTRGPGTRVGVQSFTPYQGAGARLTAVNLPVAARPAPAAEKPAKAAAKKAESAASALAEAVSLTRAPAQKTTQVPLVEVSAGKVGKPASAAAAAPSVPEPSVPAFAAKAAAPSRSAIAGELPYIGELPKLVRPTPASIVGSVPPAGTNQAVRLQVGAYKTPKNAVVAFDRLKEAGLEPAYERSGDVYRVVLAGVTAENVQGVAEKLGAAGFREAVVK